MHVLKNIMRRGLYSWIGFCSLPYPFGCLRRSRSHCLPLLPSTLVCSSHVSFSGRGCLIRVTLHECHQATHLWRQRVMCSVTVECAHGRQAIESGANFFYGGTLFCCHFVWFWDRVSRIRDWPLLSTYLLCLGGPWIANPPASTSIVIRLYVCATTSDFLLSR